MSWPHVELTTTTNKQLSAKEVRGIKAHVALLNLRNGSIPILKVWYYYGGLYPWWWDGDGVIFSGNILEES